MYDWFVHDHDVVCTVTDVHALQKTLLIIILITVIRGNVLLRNVTYTP